ncbi:hypothetical protein AK88_05387 [Plasmodium fragile]|uniref:Schizont-infected cell agglutination extracellular alpha domain-containing protein n=1 Tax=Plasmodium fragile TaxID=5857 RepID=A0A0D9QDQ8_PLAFR|nr:uncharacterized protein AK88_05387 [Plasmodium fragile]KJP84977.1 hypothetical protein AK88_05387 [Plasmodium fragile]
MGTVDLANALVKWVLAAGISTQEDYEDMVWNKTKDVMHEFVDYMDGDHIILYAANCDNKGWERPDDPTPGHFYVPRTVGHKIVCVLMVGALFFMNGWTITQKTRSTEDETSERIREHLLCAIVHMFSEVLNESVCPSMWGTYYAWKIMEKMETGAGGVSGGLIKQRKCGQDLFAHLKTTKLNLNADVKKWLREHSKLQEAIQKIQGKALCTEQWKDDWNLDDILGNGHVPHAEGSQIVQIVHELKAGLGEVFKGIKQQVEQGIEQREQAKKKNLAKDDQNGEAATTATVPAATTGSTAEEAKKKQTEGSDSRKEKDKASPQEPQGGGTQTTQTSTTPSPGSTGTGSPGKTQAQPTGGVGEGRADHGVPDTSGGKSQASSPPGQASQPQAPASPVLPARPPQPEATPGAGAAGPVPQPPPAAPPSHSETQSPKGPTSGPETTPAKGSGEKDDTRKESGTRTEETVRAIDDLELGPGTLTTTIISIPYDPAPAPDIFRFPELKEDVSGDKDQAPQPAQAPTNEPSQTTTETGQDETTKEDGKDTLVSGTPQKDIPKVTEAVVSSPPNPQQEDGAASIPGPRPASGAEGNIVIDGGNDDPPPLNPPKHQQPKPNPNPEQTGRIGTGGDPGQAGKDGKSGEDGDPGNKAADQDEFSVTTSLWGIGRPAAGSGGGTAGSGDGAGKAACGEPQKGSTTGPSESNVPTFDIGQIIPAVADSPGGGFVPPILTDGSSSSSGGNQGPGEVTPDVPELTAAVLTATTPILLFVASVIVAVLGYSLWKPLNANPLKSVPLNPKPNPRTLNL